MKKKKRVLTREDRIRFAKRYPDVFGNVDNLTDKEYEKLKRCMVSFLVSNCSQMITEYNENKILFHKRYKDFLKVKK